MLGENAVQNRALGFAALVAVDAARRVSEAGSGGACESHARPSCEMRAGWRRRQLRALVTRPLPARHPAGGGHHRQRPPARSARCGGRPSSGSAPCAPGERPEAPCRCERLLRGPRQALHRQLQAQRLALGGTAPHSAQLERSATSRVASPAPAVVRREPCRDVERDPRVQRAVRATGEVDAPGA